MLARASKVTPFERGLQRESSNPFTGSARTDLFPSLPRKSEVEFARKPTRRGLSQTTTVFTFFCCQFRPWRPHEIRLKSIIKLKKIDEKRHIQPSPPWRKQPYAHTHSFSEASQVDEWWLPRKRFFFSKNELQRCSPLNFQKQVFSYEFQVLCTFDCCCLTKHEMMLEVFELNSVFFGYDMQTFEGFLKRNW